MIVIHLQLANISIGSLITGLLAIAPCCIGFILASGTYANILSLQIPAYFTAAASILVVFTQFAGIFWSYNIFQAALSIISALISMCAGMYYLTVSVKEPSYISQDWGLNSAFLITWLLSLLFTVIISSFSIGAMWCSTFGDLSKPFDANSEDFMKDYNMEKPLPTDFGSLGVNSFQGSQDIGTFGNENNITALNIPFYTSDPPQTPDIGTQRLNSPPLSDMSSIISLGSDLDINAHPDTNANTQTFEPNSQNNHENLNTNKPRTSIDLDMKSLVKRPSSLFKIPKSPKKITLSKSSFSLRRSPSKSEKLSTPQTSTSTLPMPDAILATPPPKSFPPLHSRSFNNGASLATPFGKTYNKWIMFPNGNAAESRSVSESSQVTGKIFPAAEYNRKINSAGFQKDEPIPVQLSPSGHTVSQYELERTSRVKHHQ